MTIAQLNTLPEELKKIIKAGNSAKDIYSSRNTAITRNPCVITTVQSINDPDRILQCWVNPSEAGWTASQRGTIQPVRGGAIRYLWYNRKHKTFFGEPKISFSFQSGNIHPNQRENYQGYKIVPSGLDNFYLFLDLMDEKPRTTDNAENYHLVFHNSLVFPAILLKGWFDPSSGVSFTESAEGSYEVKWTATMEIIETVPHINNVEDLRNIYGIAFRDEV